MTNDLGAPAQPLAGLRVLELGQIYNGPYCGLLFAHLGAEVIKIEAPRGELLRFRADPSVESREFLMLNSSKQSLPLDLKSETGRAVFLDLVERSDVVIENFSVGVMDRLALSYDRLRAQNPRIVYARGTGYGAEGPHANLQAMDLTVQAIAGVISSTGFADGPPVKTGPAFADFIAGVHLFAGAVAALYQRDRTGEGSLVETAMYDAVFPTLASPLSACLARDDVPERVGNRHSGLSVAPYNIYAASDGYVAIFCVSNRHWRRLAQCMGHPALLNDERFTTPYLRARHMDEIDAAVEAWTSTKSRAEVFERLAAAEVPGAPVQTVEEVARDPHLVGNGMSQTVEHPVLGSTVVPGSAIRFPGSPPICRLAPRLGEHTRTVLRNVLGYDDATIDGLAHDGVVTIREEEPAGSSMEQ